MTHLEACENAAAQLGIVVEGSTLVALGNGRELLADMVVPHFGAPMGTLVFTDANAYLPHIDKLYEMGFAVSSYGEPCEHLTSGDFREMLLDWTWCGPAGARPSWA